jgi:NDP-4-keto-2,6-dideoxyhexose 3-C-methyltransferase
MLELNCRACGATQFSEVLNLGEMAFTGYFPVNPNDEVPSGELNLVRCLNPNCNLIQLANDFLQNLLFNENYGYRSNLNPNMLNHLVEIPQYIQKFIQIDKGDVVLDIGSNDGTLLRQFQQLTNNLIGIDPIAKKYLSNYPKNAEIINDFFSTNLRIPKKAKVITSIAMLYDVPDLDGFFAAIESNLTDDGIWVSEQSYLPRMIDNLAFDTICHEHLTYLTLNNINFLALKNNLKIIDVEINNINGSTFRITLTKNQNPARTSRKVMQTLAIEKLFISRIESYFVKFDKEIKKLKQELNKILQDINSNQGKVYGLGASTKGNTLLQFIEASPLEIVGILEINKDKFGKFTPGTKIPIIDELEVAPCPSDYVLVLPWHFASYFNSNIKYTKWNLIYPCPTLTIRKADFSA